MDTDRLLEVFGLTGNFTQSDLAQAYKDLVQVWHPDKYSYNPRLQRKAEEKLKEINNARILLQERSSRSHTRLARSETPKRYPHSGYPGIHHDDMGQPESAINATTRPAASGASDISLRSVFHPTNFSEASAIAFNHALKIAVTARAQLSIVHVAPTQDDFDFAAFPEVRHTLERWGLLPAGSSREDVFEKTGLLVEKVVAVDEDPVLSMLHFLERHSMDLIVLATHQFKEPVRWVKKTVAEPLARASGEITLFIPQGTEGFVSHRDGAVRLQRMLIPVDHHPSPQRAIDAASALARVLGCRHGRFTLLHVGDPHAMPVVNLPMHEGWEWENVIRHGDVVQEILTLERERAVDLLVMTTQGHDGFLDALRGSTTERVLRGARCPLLAIPAQSKDATGE